MSDETVPDLYRLAFIPGCFRCPKCGFSLTKQCINVNAEVIGTREQERNSEPCPNDGTMMVHVTYRERLADYDAELTRRIEGPRALHAFLLELLAALEAAIKPAVWHHTIARMQYGNKEQGFEDRLAILIHLEDGMYPLFFGAHDFSKTVPALVDEIVAEVKRDDPKKQKFPYG